MTKATLSLLLAAALAVPGFALAAPGASAHRGRSTTLQVADAGDGARVAGDHESARRARRGHDPERRIARMAAELELDANQARLVREVMQAARLEREALRELPRSPERRAQMRAIMERAHERIDALLTPGQRLTLDARRAERAERMDQRARQRMEQQSERSERGLERTRERSERGLERSRERSERALQRGVRRGERVEATEARGRERGVQRGERGARAGGIDPRGI